MKQITAILLIFLVILQPCSKFWIFVSFKLNQDYITKTLCIKKEVKNNCCRGKCHLEKALKYATNSNRQTQFNLNNRYKLLNFNIISNTILSLSDYKLTSKKIISSYYNLYSYSFCFEIFRPPKKSKI